MKLLSTILGVAVLGRYGFVDAVSSKGLSRLVHGSQRRTLSVSSRAITSDGDDVRPIGSFSLQDTDEENETANSSSNSTFESSVTVNGEVEAPPFNVTEEDASVTTASATINMTNESFVKSSIERLEALYPYLNVTRTPEEETKDKRGMIQFPNLDAGSGTGHSYLMQSPGSTIVSAETRCRTSNDECTWLYSEANFSLRVQSPDVCGDGNGNNFSCCLRHADVPDDPTVSIGKCTECSGTRCEWCMTPLNNAHSVIHPKVADACPGCVACRCLGARQNGGEVEVSIREAGGDNDCNMMWMNAI